MRLDDPYKFLEFWRPEEPEASERDLKALVMSAKATGDACLVAELLSFVARCQGQLGRLEEAHDTLNDADFALIGQAPHRAHARALLERGRVFLACGWEDSGHKFLGQAVAAAASARAPELAEEAEALLRETG